MSAFDPTPTFQTRWFESRPANFKPSRKCHWPGFWSPKLSRLSQCWAPQQKYLFKLQHYRNSIFISLKMSEASIVKVSAIDHLIAFFGFSSTVEWEREKWKPLPLFRKSRIHPVQVPRLNECIYRVFINDGALKLYFWGKFHWFFRWNLFGYNK